MATRASNDTVTENTEKAVATETAEAKAADAAFKPVKLRHKDGRERVATTAREQVSAEFDGFAVVKK